MTFVFLIIWTLTLDLNILHVPDFFPLYWSPGDESPLSFNSFPFLDAKPTSTPVLQRILKFPFCSGTLPVCISYLSLCNQPHQNLVTSNNNNFPFPKVLWVGQFSLPQHRSYGSWFQPISSWKSRNGWACLSTWSFVPASSQHGSIGVAVRGRSSYCRALKA